MNVKAHFLFLTTLKIVFVQLVGKVTLFSTKYNFSRKAMCANSIELKEGTFHRNCTLNFSFSCFCVANKEILLWLLPNNITK